VDPKFLTQVAAQKYSGTFGFAGMDSEMAKLADDKKFKWESTNFPSITKENYDGLTAGELNPLAGLRNGWVISKKSENQELAVDFLQFLTSPEEVSKLYAVKRAAKGDTLQADASAIANITYAAEAKKVDAGMKYAELTIFGFGLPPVFDTGKDFSDFHVQWQGLWSGALTIDQFLEKRSASSLAALERNLQANKDLIDQAFIDEQLK
jgi:ABC-type glycerol-3-phosphate transport system substrate-binding protein